MMRVEPAIAPGRRHQAWLPARPFERGFTLVELVTVIVLIGIMGGLAMARFADNVSFDTYAYADRTAAMLRYGQKLAVAQNRPVYVALDGSRVALCFNPACDASTGVSALGGSNSGRPNTLALCASSAWECEAPANGVTYVSDVSSFYFDPLGKPFASSDIFPRAISTFTRLTITVSGGNSSKVIIVEPETGYVH
jgi:MSHA pilin protein MshC